MFRVGREYQVKEVLSFGASYFTDRCCKAVYSADSIEPDDENEYTSKKQNEIA